jgi:phosphoribosylaminoimidazolecarboxamide formyltransferase/IMP cyclohydrolase
VTHGVEILSTGGTAKLLRDQKIAVTEVSDFTGSPEILNGRVKTLHPKIHGGLLSIRDNVDHQKQMEKNGILPIDLVIVNLYAFEKNIADSQCTLEHAIENIDIGGPSMLRSAAKNHRDVTVVTDPSDYAELEKQIAATGGTTEDFRFRLAVKVFQKTSAYDAAIANYLSNIDLQSGRAQRPVPTQICPQNFVVTLTKIQDLRYGENPHQKAAFYRDQNATHGLVNAQQLHGKELSFNNILDTQAAYGACQEFQEPACVIIKHANPCGTATAETLRGAFLRAKSGDPVSAFGGIVALNRQVDKETALALSEIFFEVILAPNYDAAALEILKAKKNLRLLVLKDFHQTRDLDYRRVSGGFLVQDQDEGRVDLAKCVVPTKIKPTPMQLTDLAFAWQIVKHVKSNAIVFARGGQTLGVGAGQMSRVDSVRIATMKAREIFQNQDILKGSVMASDAFFPFRDGVDLAIQAGVAAIVQPGGSVRDEEVIKTCDEAGVAMVFTGMRHFRH